MGLLNIMADEVLTVVGAVFFVAEPELPYYMKF